MLASCVSTIQAFYTINRLINVLLIKRK